MLQAAKNYFDRYELFYESPVDKQLKDGSVETRMVRLPNPPPSIIDIARTLGVARSSVYLWMDSHPEFSDCIKKGIERLYPEVLQENAIMGKYAPAFSIFAAKNRMGWHDKQEIDHTHHIEPMVLLSQETGKTLATLGSQVANKAA